MAESSSSPKESNAQPKNMVTPQGKDPHRRKKRAELLSADRLRKLHRIARAQYTTELETDEIHISNTLKDKIYSSKTAFVDLTRTVIADLILEERATDKYIIVRIIEEGYGRCGYYTVVEDHEGNVCTLLIYNFPLEEFSGSIGYVLIIKEPYFKTSLDDDAHIRCDSPTDILILRPCFHLYHLAGEIEWKNKLEEGIVHDVLIGDSEPPVDPGQWVERGDQLINENQLVAAREAYRLGMRCCETDDPNYKTLRIKLLNVHVTLGWPEWAVTSCGDIFGKFPDDPETLFRLGRAYYMLRKYRAALEIHEKYCSMCPKEEEAQRVLVQMKARVREENGEIDVEELRKTSRETPLEVLECGDYWGPVEITRISGKGRGLVLTKNVTKGSILIASQALVVAHLRKNAGNPYEVNTQEDEFDYISLSNVAQLTRLIYKHPNVFGPRVYDLFTGTYTKEPIKQFCNPELKKEPICDVEKLRAIYECNKFVLPELDDGETVVQGAGLFWLPSYLNHNCSPNVDTEFYNNVMVVRARKNLKADTELTTSYVPLDMKFEERTEMLKRRGINKCLCGKCKQKR